MAAQLEAARDRDGPEATPTIGKEAKDTKEIARTFGEERTRAAGEAPVTTRGIEWVGDRAKTSAALAPRGAELPYTSPSAPWQEKLRSLATSTRRDLLADLPALVRVIDPLDGEEAIARIFRAIQDGWTEVDVHIRLSPYFTHSDLNEQIDSLQSKGYRCKWHIGSDFLEIKWGGEDD